MNSSNSAQRQSAPTGAQEPATEATAERPLGGAPCSLLFIQTPDQSGNGNESDPVSGTDGSCKVDLVSHPDAAEIWSRAQACPVCLEELAGMTKRPVAQLKRFLDLWTEHGQPDPQEFWEACRRREVEDRFPRVAVQR
jgi:hypothetical protein